MGYKEDFIKFMAKSNVLTFGDFITKSGRKTPYFINTGNYNTGSQIANLGDFYARCISESGEQPDALFGPAYKGIPLSVSAASSMYRLYGRDIPYCFNRKEAKDHGEGGEIVGYKPKGGERIAVIEDVVTAGTAMRETAAFLSQFKDVTITALFVSVDRMERGTGECSALEELKKEFGINIYPIVTVRNIIATLHNNDVDGMIYIDDKIRDAMEEYLNAYGTK